MPDSHWAVSLAYGASCEIERGIVGTQASPGRHRLEFYSGKTTAIVGADEGVETGEICRASWVLPTRPSALAGAKRVFVVLACIRYFGGLHSRTYDASANVLLNGYAIDRVNLRVRPETHSDYFHRVPLPTDLPRLNPIVECSTVYAWPVQRHHLNLHSTSQRVTIELDPDVSWDIDYIGLVHQAPHRIFISYSRKDRQIAETLRKRLSQVGISTWVDTQEIKLGDSLIQKIQSAIDGVEYVCALLSRNSIQSAWVQKEELEVALTREINGRKTIVIPIILDDCEIPSFLKAKSYADLRRPRRYQRVLKEIVNLLDQ